MPIMEYHLLPVICTSRVHLTCYYYTWSPTLLRKTAFLKTNPGHSFENAPEVVPEHQWSETPSVLPTLTSQQAPLSKHISSYHSTDNRRFHAIKPSPMQAVSNAPNLEETETFSQRRSTQNLILAHSQVQYKIDEYSLSTSEGSSSEQPVPPRWPARNITPTALTEQDASSPTDRAGFQHTEEQLEWILLAKGSCA